MNRREFLKNAGVLTLLCVGGRVYRLTADSESGTEKDPGLEPWETWREDSKAGPLALVRAAIISSNAYNSQPFQKNLSMHYL